MADEFDPRHDTPIRVKIKDTVTGEEKWSEGEFATFGTWWWTEGNGGCDCNRRLAMGHKPVDKCTSVRYRIIDVSPLLNGYTIQDFNEEYP